MGGKKPPKYVIKVVLSGYLPSDLARTYQTLASGKAPTWTWTRTRRRRRQSDKISHIDMGDDHIDTVISQFISLISHIDIQDDHIDMVDNHIDLL